MLRVRSWRRPRGCPPAALRSHPPLTRAPGPPGPVSQLQLLLLASALPLATARPTPGPMTLFSAARTYITSGGPCRPVLHAHYEAGIDGEPLKCAQGRAVSPGGHRKGKLQPSCGAALWPWHATASASVSGRPQGALTAIGLLLCTDPYQDDTDIQGNKGRHVHPVDPGPHP